MPPVWSSAASDLHILDVIRAALVIGGDEAKALDDKPLGFMGQPLI
jgi:hypothetical protein